MKSRLLRRICLILLSLSMLLSVTALAPLDRSLTEVTSRENPRSLSMIGDNPSLVQGVGVWIGDGNWFDKYIFRPGEPIQWAIDIQNTNASNATVLLTFDVYNPYGQNIRHSSGNVSTQPGIWSWALSGFAANYGGVYTFVGSARYGGVTHTFSTTYAVQTFDDVSTGHPFWRYIEAFANTGITVGCSQVPKMYCPDANVTRGEMAVFIERAKGNYSPPTNAVHPFTDVPYPGLEHFTNFIELFYSHNITTGCQQSPLMYCPQNNVTRGEMAVFIERAIGKFSPPTNAVHPFTDVPYPGLEHFTNFIEQFYYDGITVGCQQSPLMYCPQNNVTRGEMAVFIVRAFQIAIP